ncbi:MAG: hypothetical protein M3Q30_13225 [Actinomycetota bacterium]|nr:hypothetical protein [Actinomycetota bacterium]
MTIIEGVEVDQALIDELRRHGERLAALMPEVRDLFREMVPVLARVESIHWEMGPFDDDEVSERFGMASGSWPVIELMSELNQLSDYDLVYRDVVRRS